jgi:hypothetical protein
MTLLEHTHHSIEHIYCWHVGLIDPHKVVIRRNTFLALGSAQNESVLDMIESFGHGRL